MATERPFGRRLVALVVAAGVVLGWAAPARAGVGPREALPYYFWVTSTQSVKCLTVAGASTADDAPVVQQPCSDTAYHQFWSFLYVDDHYLMVVRHSGKCLSVLDAAAGNGALVVQRTCDAGDSQQWTFPYVGGNNYLAVARHSGKCLTAVGTADDAPVVQWTCRARVSQQWRLGF